MTAFLDIAKSIGQSIEDFGREVEARYGNVSLDGLIEQGLQGPGNRVPNTRVVLSHGLTLRTADNRRIGAVHEWQDRQSREVNLRFGIYPAARGQPAAIVPGRATGHTLSIARYDLYTKWFEEAFGEVDLTVLEDQRVGLRCREQWRAPISVLSQQARAYEYSPCFFTDKGRKASATDGRIVMVDATLTYLSKVRIA